MSFCLVVKPDANGAADRTTNFVWMFKSLPDGEWVVRPDAAAQTFTLFWSPGNYEIRSDYELFDAIVERYRKAL